MARKSCQFAGGFSLLHEFPENTLYLLSTPRPPFSPSPSTNSQFLKFSRQIKELPQSHQDLQKCWKQSHKCDQCQMWLPSETSSGRKEWSSSLNAQPNLSHPEQLNQQILILTFPGGFSAWNERGCSHSSSYQDHICCWEKRQQILRENCLSAAYKILSSLWTFYCCSGVRNTH